MRTFKISMATTIALFISIVATAQSRKFKVGDKVEAFYGSKWHTGQVTGFYGSMYTVKEESTGLTFYPDDNEIRSAGTSSSVAQKPEEVGRKYKVGDKAEAYYDGKWHKGQVTGYYGQRYTLKEDATGLTYYPDDNEIRGFGGSAPSATNRNERATEISDTPCDWSAWGVMGKANLLSLASEVRDIPLKDLLCQVRSRKVDFKLTAAEEATVNAYRNSPELLQAIRDSYQGAKVLPKVTASSIKPGHYSCSKMLLGSYRKRDDLFILPNNQYKTEGSSKVGRYSFNSATSEITWSSGTYQEANMLGGYEADNRTITLYNTAHQIEHACNWVEN